MGRPPVAAAARTVRGLSALRVLRVPDRWPGEAVLDAVREAMTPGALLVYPTETLYGLGGRASDAEAARRTRLAKGRPDAKPLPVVAADLEQVEALCPGWRPLGEALAKAFWPGPLTLVLEAAAELPSELTSGTGTLAVRVPGRALTRALCAALGPLVATSANRSGGAAPLTCREALEAVGEHAALALDAGPGGGLASTVVSLASGAPRLVREGAVAWSSVRRHLGGG